MPVMDQAHGIIGFGDNDRQESIRSPAWLVQLSKALQMPSDHHSFSVML